MTWFRRSGYAMLGAVAGVWTVVTNRPWALRILAYHDVPDGEVFRQQLTYLVEHYAIVDDPHEVADRGKPSVWMTFDDGDPSIFKVALPLLAEFGVRATAFVCPGLIGTGDPFWWQIVEHAAAESVKVGGVTVSEAEVSVLKRVSDRERRMRVGRILESLEHELGTPLKVPTIAHEDLIAWIGAGHALGNHTWDHPILSTCSADDQDHQIRVAHDWFRDAGLPTPTAFAYPNGDWAPESEQTLQDLGYAMGLLFDHKVAALPPSLRMSRIRVNAQDPVSEFAARVSGLHPKLIEVRR